jgi:dienelactone hydrolase
MEQGVKPYTEELVEVTTADDVPLAGALVRPAGGATHPLLVLWIHGAGVRFYLQSVLDVCRGLARRGYACLSINTRGHDFVTRLNSGRRRTLAGTAYERIEECGHDLRAWLDLAAARGFGRVALVGHSYGGVKAVYDHVMRPDERVATVVLASSNSAIAFGAGEQLRAAPELVALAERMEAEGRGEELLPWGSTPGEVLPTVSAQTYLSRARAYPFFHGDGVRPPALARIRCPLFAFFVAGEPGAGAGRLEVVRRTATAAPRVETQLVEGAEHVYRGCEEPVAAAIAAWLDSLR